jgi:hypothetical protein
MLVLKESLQQLKPQVAKLMRITELRKRSLSSSSPTKVNITQLHLKIPIIIR